MSYRLLLVEDDQELAELLIDYLELESFTITWETRGDKGLNVALTENFDVIILDIMLPGINGVEFLKEFRQQRLTPVIMLTARGEELDRILGFELGADDYLPKPCSPRELVARIKAVIRRVVMDQQTTKSIRSSNVVMVGPLYLNLSSHEATVSGQPLNLTGTEFEVLSLLMQHTGEVVSKETLSLQALGKQLSLYDRSIDMHVSNLRKKIADVYDNPSLIKTIRGKGYLLKQF
ncbi:response regulator [Endozoicomonas sp. SM1973]|uniref:Response regulator n=1 Tax=Spartinivicinus marinus TaxID=2994442 RepID=A0A853I0Q4_9GAMM|nr:response regulator [Spartinivicinus marinus]MCX4026997.1 response regulator [Spartinivicinus marinus]NYZ66993.1 response regulator [Spartinivicinus marinus]